MSINTFHNILKLGFGLIFIAICGLLSIASVVGAAWVWRQL